MWEKNCQRSLLDQHYDFYHTNKPKRFVCKPCNKAFPLKKTLQEHNCRLHNNGDFKFVCNVCGQGFFVRGEYTAHMLSHKEIKPYKCGICDEKSFATPSQLNAHMKRCGKPSQIPCHTCNKHFSTQQHLETHMREVHKKKVVTWKCPFCEDCLNSSDSGYFKHLRKMHDIGRNKRKLEEVILEEERKKKKKDTEESDDQNGDGNSSPKKSKPSNDD